jgi:Na+/melibiose symporter-like transporter
MKVGSAISGYVAGTGLSHFGFIANVQQTGQTLGGIRLLISFIPIAFIILGMILIFFYPIDAAYHKRILVELEKRGK